MNIDDLLKLAVEHHQAGRWIEAHKFYKQVLAINPDEPDALRLLGQLTFASGSAKNAIALVERAIALRPGVVDFHRDLGRIAMGAEDYPRAVSAFSRALEINPFPSPETHFELARALAAAGENQKAIDQVQITLQAKPTADAMALLGGLLLATGRVQQAADQLQKAIALEPQRADFLSTYALVMQQRGDFDLAESSYRQALRMNPKFAEVRNNLGYLLLLRKQLPQAIVELKEAIALKPIYPQAFSNLALAYTGLGETDLALSNFRTALQQEPRMPATWESLARVLLDLRQYPSAITALDRAIALEPTSSRYILLSIAHGGLEDLDSAIQAATAAVEIDPNSAAAHDSLGAEFKWARQFEPAMEQFNRALEIDPQYRSAHSHLVYAMLMMDGPTPEEILQAHVRWGGQQLGGIAAARRPRNLKDPNRRLRIGYISHNFRSQAVSAFVLPILQHHDRTQLDIYCYSDVEIPDQITRRIQGYATYWRESWGMDDAQLAKQIREDRIDILIELTGHIGKGRLGALAYLPAPVQVSYIGYQGTTGVSAVDYVLTDDWTDPAGNERFYVEKPYRLPESFFVYEPPGDAPLVGPLPANRNGHVTFGCLNAVSKVSPRCVGIWSQILLQVPGSTLMLLTTQCTRTNQQLLEEFASAGIEASRVQLVPRANPEVYYRRYNAIDIALDPMPFNGHTTTCDAAWMGCPTVNLSGQIYAHRYGGSVLRNLNLSSLVTESAEQYIAAGVGLANDLDQLAKIRSTLRFTMQRSIITDGRRFTQNLEAAYRHMWKTWCSDE